jgi:hypothetical protein
MNVAETIGWAVESVDADGIATMTVTVESVTGKINGVPVDSPALPPVRVKVTKDGQMLSAMGFAPDLSSGLGNSIPGSEQFLPPLPDHPVEPGDTWTVSYDQDVPYGSGKLRYSATNTLLRYEDVDGVSAAVIQTRLELPFDLSFDLDKLIEAFGGGEATGQLPKDASMAFAGKLVMNQTSWFDPARGELLKASLSGNFDMDFEFTGLPKGSLPVDEASFVGTLSVNVDRLSADTGQQTAQETSTKKHKKHRKHKKSG